MNTSHGHQYLLEIGTEELPLEFLLSAPTELTDKVKAMLDEQGVGYGEVTVYATPRRLALLIQDLPEQQAARTFKTKGPPLRVGLDAEGQPTQAGLGFARKLGVDFSALTQESIEGETYLVLNQNLPRRPVQDLLVELLPGLVLGLSGSHFMAWNRHTVRFSRPLRWLVSLWDQAHLPIVIGPVQSGVKSQGHRVLAQEPVQITSPSQYLAELEASGAVLADQQRRRQVIWSALQAQAAGLGGAVAENEGLLNTVNMLVEQPSVVVGRFEERFLDIPEEVTTTVMIAHQKYFPVRDSESGRLLPCFMTVSNGCQKAADTIRHGNEKVLTARLEDARFFFTEDQKIPLAERLEALQGITFQKGLGSMLEKTRRLERLSQQVALALHASQPEQSHIQRAAMLAKADLVTGMVFEFTELQGVMGRQYALLNQEPAPVAEAIFEHYLPRFPGDAVAKSPVGIAVSIADKLDTLVAVFSQKNAKLPSGSKDPLGLRRMASGLIQTVLENQLSIDILALLRLAYQFLAQSAPATAQFQDEATTLALVEAFILQRFRGWLLEQDNRYDVIDAVLEAEKQPLQDLQDVLVRIECLKQITANTDTLKRLYEPANRIFKILGSQYNPQAQLTDVQASAFRDEAEAALVSKIQPLDAMLKRGSVDYTALNEALVGLAEVIEQFFEKVMVNDPDDTVRKNRYNLLSVLNRFYLQLACFSKLVV